MIGRLPGTDGKWASQTSLRLGLFFSAAFPFLCFPSRSRRLTRTLLRHRFALLCRFAATYSSVSRRWKQDSGCSHGWQPQSLEGMSLVPQRLEHVEPSRLKCPPLLVWSPPRVRRSCSCGRMMVRMLLRPTSLRCVAGEKGWVVDDCSGREL